MVPLQMLLDACPIDGVAFQNIMLEAFTRTMDPEAPEHCARFYEAAIVLMQTYNDISTLPLTHSKLFSTALRFLTHSRTQEDLRQLELRMSKCHCVRTALSNVLHGPTVVLPEPIGLLTLFDSLSSLLRLCFLETSGPRKDQGISLDTIRKRAKKAQKEGRQARWPQQSSDLFIFPAKQILTMLWQIYHTYESIGVLLFLQIIDMAAGTTFISLYHTIPSLPQDYLYHFERGISSIRDDYSKLRAIAAHWIPIHLKSTPNSHERGILWRPHIHDVLTLFSKAISSLSSQPELDIVNLRAFLSQSGAYLIGEYRTRVDLDLTLYAPEILRLTTGTKSEPQGGSVATAVWRKVFMLARADICQAPGCGETFSKQSRRFAVCKGCGILSYCSKSCQVAAWRHPDIPHQPLCTPLGVFREKFIKRGLDWRSRALDQAAAELEYVAELCRDAGVTEEEAEVLMPHLMLL